MSTLALCGNGMVMPSKYVQIDSTEMEYIEGGGSIAIRNSGVACCINIALNAALAAAGGVMCVAGKAALSEAGRTIFLKNLKKNLFLKGLALIGGSWVADKVIDVLEAFNVMASPGTKIAKKLDSRDSKPNNGYWNISW